VVVLWYDLSIASLGHGTRACILHYIHTCQAHNLKVAGSNPAPAPNFTDTSNLQNDFRKLSCFRGVMEDVPLLSGPRP